MSFEQKTWVDRDAQYRGRIKLTNVSTGDSATYDMARAEGEVYTTGDSVSAVTMNDLEQRLADGINSSIEEAQEALESSIESATSEAVTTATAAATTATEAMEAAAESEANAQTYMETAQNNAASDLGFYWDSDGFLYCSIG